MTKNGNQNLHNSKKDKADEFYTDLGLIESELKHYRPHFKGKTVLCNCDDPRVSQFFHYFAYNFEFLGLKKLITTCYKSQDVDLFSQHDCEKAVYLVYEGDKNGNFIPDAEEIGVLPLRGDGDFRSPECLALLDEADIVVTNPPFSLFREYMDVLVRRKKKFLILGNMNAVTYADIFSQIKSNQIWLGHNSGHFWFRVPDHYEAKNTDYKEVDGVKYRRMGNICWYTNLDHSKRHEDLILYKNYMPEEYPKYDNYDAIHIEKTSDIPCDYDGVMGVPITFMDKFNPAQFEVLGATESEGKGLSCGLWDAVSGVAQPLVHGARVYKRIFIRLKRPSQL